MLESKRERRSETNTLKKSTAPSLMLSKVPRSIFSSSGAVGRDDGRSGPERNVELRKEQKKRDIRTGLLRIRKEKEKEEGKKIGADLQCRQLSIGAASAHANGLPECLQVTSLQRRGFPHRMMSSLYIPPSLFLTYCQIHFLCASARYTHGRPEYVPVDETVSENR